jgi:hypothetical protein
MRNRKTMFTTRDDRKPGHASNFTMRRSRATGYVCEIVQRATGWKVLTTLDQDELNDLARQLDKWRTDK